MADTPAVWLCPVFFVFLLFVIGGVNAGSYCYENFYTSVTYCDNGCCGNSSGNQYCCEWNPTVGLIVGCVFGGLFLISVIAVVVCCCIKKKGHSGKVISPTTGSLLIRPGATRASQVSAPPATVTTTTQHQYQHHHSANQMAAFFPGTWGVPATHYDPHQQPLPPPGYSPHHLPPLVGQQPPAYQVSVPPPPAYDYGTGQPQQQHQLQQQQQVPVYGYAQGMGADDGSSGAPSGTVGHSPAGVPTTAYGNNFVV